MTNLKLARRKFLHLVAAAAAQPFAPYVAKAQGYPARPVRWIVGFAAGGTGDILMRLIGQGLSERLGQQFIIENRPGAANNIATESVVNAPPDGYTLLLANPANAINATLYDKLAFNFVRDIAPVAGIMAVPQVVVINPRLPVATPSELISYAKANPGKLNMASGGNGSSVHVAGEHFKMMAGINMVHVPYRGAGPALVDLIAGQVHVMFDNMPSSIEYIRSGQLRALAVTTTTRSETLPDVPTAADVVPGYEASGWFGVAAPKNTSREVIDKLNREINSVATAPAMKARLAQMGGTVIAGTPAEFGKLIEDETEKWGKVVKFAGLKPE